jgi:hypothetical protein
MGLVERLIYIWKKGINKFSLEREKTKKKCSAEYPNANQKAHSEIEQRATS